MRLRPRLEAPNNGQWTNGGGSLSLATKALVVAMFGGLSGTTLTPPDFNGTHSPIYVSTTGNDANSGTIGSPKTLSIATIQAGWRTGVGLYLRAGTYTWPSGVDTRLSGYASGTSDSWGIIKAYNGESVTINFNTNTGTFGSNSCLVDSRQYLAIRDVTIATPTTAFYFGDVGSTSYFWAHNVSFNFAGGSGTAFDNTAPMGCGNDRMDYLYMTGCRVVGQSNPSTWHQNANGLWCGRIKHLYVVGNFFDYLPIGIYYKYDHADSVAANVDIQIHNNVVTRCSRWSWEMEGRYASFGHNLLVSSAPAASGEDGGVQGGDDLYYFHNTFYDTDLIYLAASGGSPGSLRNITRDNAFLAGAQFMPHPYASGYIASLCDGDYNLFIASSPIQVNATTYSLASYQSAFSGQEAHSVSGTPTLASGTPTVADVTGFAIVSGAGNAAASDGTDMGCDTSRLYSLTYAAAA